MLRRLGMGLGLLVVLAFGTLAIVSHFSGVQIPIDIVALTAARDGVPLESSMIEAHGIRLHVVQAGPVDGPPVVLLHGYPEFWWAWHAQIARLALAGFRVIAPDQRGYNGSDKPDGVSAYTRELLAQDLVDLIHHLGHQQVYLAGHDWGGAIAWKLVIEHPELFRKLVMFNAPHPFSFRDVEQSPEAKPKTINWYRYFFQLSMIPEMVGRLGNWGLLVDNLRQTSRPGTFPDADMDLYRYAWDRDDSMHAMVNWYRAAGSGPDIAGDGQVKIPVRIVWGFGDRFFDSRLAKLSLNHCANATLVEVPNAGHWLLHEEPDLTSQQMIEFFQAP